MKRLLCFFVFFLCMLSMLSVSAAQNIVSLHKSYKILTPMSEGYPDEGGELTNGKFGTPVDNGAVSYHYQNTEYVGFRRSDGGETGEIAILLDLGERYTDLWDFEIGYLHEPEVGIQAPVMVAFYIADEENGDYTLIGETSPADAKVKAGILTIQAKEGLDGRYVKVVITPGENTAWTFLDEISILQGRNTLIADPSTASSADTSIESSAESSVSEQSSAAQNAVPQAGDPGIATFVFLCAGSLLGTVALIGRKRYL